MRKRDVLCVGTAILVIEAATFAALKAGLDYRSTLAVAGLAVVVAATWRRLLNLGTHLVRWARRSVRWIALAAYTRRRFQFSLRTLLIAVAVVASVCGWHTHRSRALRRERARLAGEWVLVGDDGAPVALPNGRPLVVQFDPQGRGYAIDPFQEPKWIDFVSPGGRRAMGLYRWEGKRLRVVQVSPGAKRPVRFGEDQFPGVEPGGNVPTPICVNEYVLEPVANPTDASEPRRRTANEPKDSDGPDPPR